MLTLKMMTKLSVAFILSALLGGCQSIAYYSQALNGHSRIWFNQREIEEVLADSSVDLQTKAHLQAASQARDFASHVLKLPENESYSHYVDLGRDYVIWNVVVTPRYSVDALQSCFPVVGCVSYRGYYKKQAALDYAQGKTKAGQDTFVGGVSAYSTLGWFDDPLLSSMLTRSNAAIVGLIFHELAHQRVYIKDDTRFNESFATAVEQIGLRQWATEQSTGQALEDYFKQKEKRSEVVGLVLEFREQLRKVYLSSASESEDELVAIKRAQFENLKSRYEKLKQAGGGTAGFDRFFASELNNASLALFGEYHGWVDAFEKLFEKSNRDWEMFYTEVEVLSQKPKVERDQILQRLSLSRAGPSGPE